MRRGVSTEIALVALLFFLSACSDPSPGAPSRPGDARRLNAPLPGESAVDRPHVVFSERSFVITKLGTPTRPPVSGASTPSSATLASDDPSIVLVDPSGQLVAVRNGRARVRALNGEGSVLQVEVKAAAAVRIDPPRLSVRPGESSRLRIVNEETGELLPAAAASWVSDSPTLVSVREGIVRAGQRPTTVRVMVRYGDAVATGVVAVRSELGEHLAIDPPQGRLRVGEVRLFRAHAAGGGVGAEWASGDASVVAAIGQGLFQARSAGRTNVCASANAERVCSSVEVKP